MDNKVKIKYDIEWAEKASEMELVRWTYEIAKKDSVYDVFVAAVVQSRLRILRRKGTRK